MLTSVIKREYAPPPFRRDEMLRYAGCKKADISETGIPLDECLAELAPLLTYRLCFCELPVERSGSLTVIGTMSTDSQALAKSLSGCDTAVIFAATVGLDADRLIKKYAHTSPSRALVIQAIASERVESLCDAFAADLSYKGRLTPRFSPGYGDLPLEAQKDIFTMLDCPRHIGLTLNNSLSMSPTKSVTAIIGVKNEAD